jgi:hypothetical protein
MSSVCEVRDLRDPDWVAVYSLSPREAVIEAYRQFELHDYNWWESNSRVPQVQEGTFVFACGDYVAKKKAIHHERMCFY